MSTFVTPVKAGVQFVYLIVLLNIGGRYWIPAFAGMSAKLGLGPRLGSL